MQNSHRWARSGGGGENGGWKRISASGHYARRSWRLSDRRADSIQGWAWSHAGLWRYRELLLVMVQRDLKIRYKNSALGFLVIFESLVDRGGDDIYLREFHIPKAANMGGNEARHDHTLLTGAG